jgi:hypothetical protein
MDVAFIPPDRHEELVKAHTARILPAYRAVPLTVIPVDIATPIAQAEARSVAACTGLYDVVIMAA